MPISVSNLYLLERPEFRSLYLAGGFDPQEIMKFGKAHGMMINRFVREDR
jgi:hypothetical protein